MNDFVRKLKRVWLTPLGSRGSAGRRPFERGIALFMVLISLALMSALVTDLGYNELVRYKLAMYERDALKAEELAASGINTSRLLLVAQSKLQNIVASFATAGMPLPSYAIWDLLPLDTDILKNLTSGDYAGFLGLDLSDTLKKRLEAHKAARERAKTKNSFEPPVGGFGAFDGSFSVAIQDEESKIPLRGWAAFPQNQRAQVRGLLLGLFAPTRYDFLFEGEDHVDRATLVANMFDWIDVNDQITDPYAGDAQWGNVGGGSEKAIYEKEPGIAPKNAFFDSLDELRLVHGMTDLHMKAFGDFISIYGQDGKVNILTAQNRVLEAIIRYCAVNPADQRFSNKAWLKDVLAGWHTYKSGGGGPVTAQGFTNYLQSRGLGINQANCQNVLGDQSYNFVVKSTATVGEVTRTLTLVTRIFKNVEDAYYFRTN